MNKIHQSGQVEKNSRCRGSQWIAAGWLIDGTGSPVQRRVLLEVKEQQIHGLTQYTHPPLNQNHPAQSSTPEAADTMDLVDLSECTLLPGLVDSHVHLTMSGTIDQQVRDHLRQAGFQEMEKLIGRHVSDHLAHGILAVRDGGDRQAFTLRYAAAARKEDHTPIQVKVQIKAAGSAWHAPGRYGALIGHAPPDGRSLSRAISCQDCRIDHVKIVNSGLNSLAEYGRQTKPQFDAAELTSAVRLAKEENLRVMVHANGAVPVGMAIDAGCDSIEHGFFMGEENLKKMADKNIAWVPTAVTMAAYARIMKKNSPEAVIAEKNLNHQLEQISLARELGVPVALGTDAGSPGVDHGRSVMEEMELLMQAGFSIEAAVRCAAKNGAGLLGLGHSGTLSPGAPASFLAVKGPPSDLPGSLTAIERIYIHGKESFKSPSIPL